MSRIGSSHRRPGGVKKALARYGGDEQTRSYSGIAPFTIALKTLLADYATLGRGGWCGKYPHIVAQLGRSFTAEDLLGYLAHRAQMEG